MNSPINGFKDDADELANSLDSFLNPLLGEFIS